MKTIATLCLALVLCFAICGSAYSGEKEQVKAQLADANSKMAFLEGVYVAIVNEFQAVSQDAKKAFAEADKALKGKKMDNLMCADALAIVTAGWYEVTLENLALKAKLIEVEMAITQQEIVRLENRLKALKKGVGA